MSSNDDDILWKTIWIRNISNSMLLDNSKIRYFIGTTLRIARLLRRTAIGRNVKRFKNNNEITFVSQCLLVLLVLFLLIGFCQGGKGTRHKSDENTNRTNRPRPNILGKDEDFIAKGKICIGTNGRMSVPSNKDHHYRNLKDRFTNCTYVDGNLELTWLSDPNVDLTFLQYIREVTGYVLISHVDIKRLVLPRLQIIRGRTLFQMSAEEDEYALAITLNQMYSVELPALRDILKGNVGIINNYNLCHIKSIDWKEIISDPKAKNSYVYNFTSHERECNGCHKDCERGCWGEGVENCQKFSKITCSPQCAEGRCFGPNPRECCHLFCAGGCTGPKQSDCIACKNFYDDGVCTSDCPSMQIYNPSTYSWEVNPNGKYAYGATCVKKCPEHLLKDNGACVRTCPLNKKAQDGECVQCDGPCPKTCVGDTTVHSGNIDKFKDCTVIEGYLNILENSFTSFQQIYPNFTFGDRVADMHPDRLEVFSTLKEVTGYLNIQAYHPEFRNLSYFRNLEVIHGRSLHEYSSSLYIVKTSLETLEFRSLKQIKMGTVAILENKHLCLAEEMNWEKIRKNHEHSLMLSNNSDLKSCKDRGLVCDDECSTDGCWGPGPDQCLSCANYQLGSKCLRDCSTEPGIYRADDNQCKPCHEQCGSHCYGAGAENCTTCKNYKDGPFCVEKCHTNKYVENGICVPCHSNCVDGCTGPKNIIGPDGCNSCEIAILNENATVGVCLHSNDSCPDGYYFEYIGPQAHDESYLKPLSGKAVCRKCHPRCKKCSGYGFHELICSECANFKKGEQCEDECAFDHYPDVATHVCIACDFECRGCSGPGPENCNSCQNFKLFDENEIESNSSFRCVTSCPPELPHRIFPENSDPYCSDKPESFPLILGKSPGYLALVCIIVIALILVTIVVGVLLYYQRKEKMKETAMKMTIALTGVDDNELLFPSNIPPNAAHLRIIKETEIRKGSTLGCGAFGVVYKGVWAIKGNESTKIPVAMKVLHKDTTANSSEEFLSEAYIMASVDHPNLLKLLAVCMTSEMVLVTQLMPLGCLLDFVRKYHDKVSSKMMLDWCTQIAAGMAYLEKKRLVHRDLAARNVLVQKPTFVKITDFGLAKLLDINEDEYKAAGGKMPIKWLALECIQHRTFTHKSDVWAFAVTVWEILSFGDRPYDNIPARDVPDAIEKGLRLPMPQIATIEVYVNMLKCWVLHAEARPGFKELEETFSKMALDPGRYLVIPGDKFFRGELNTPLQSDNEIIRCLTSEVTEMSDTDDYLHQPKSRMPIHSGATSSISHMASISPAPDLFLSAVSTPDGGSTTYPSSQNQFNHRLIRNQGTHRHFDSSVEGAQSNPSSVKYGSERFDNQNTTDVGSDEYDSSAKSLQAQIGNLKLEVPVDEDDYLMPSPKKTEETSNYIDLKNTTDHASNPNLYEELHMNNIDNPEYLMNDTPIIDQTVGLPNATDFVDRDNMPVNVNITNNPYSPNHKVNEEESDHECYSDYNDKLRPELQPLQKFKDSVV